MIGGLEDWGIGSRVDRVERVERVEGIGGLGDWRIGFISRRDAENAEGYCGAVTLHREYQASPQFVK